MQATIIIPPSRTVIPSPKRVSPQNAMSYVKFFTVTLIVEQGYAIILILQIQLRTIHQITGYKTKQNMKCSQFWHANMPLNLKYR